MSHTLLYGGTFDPIHHGHLITSLRAREILAADRTLFIPAQISPHKTGPNAAHQRQPPAASGPHRLAMIQRAIAGIPGFAADNRELARPGPSYTIDTLEEIIRDHPADQLTLLLGADQLPKLHAWHRIRDLLAKKTAGHEIALAILPRHRSPAAPPSAPPADPLQELRSHLGPAIADRLAKAFLDTPHIDISATDIRRRVAAGLPIDFLVPPAVAAYIRDHRLYQP